MTATDNTVRIKEGYDPETELIEQGFVLKGGTTQPVVYQGRDVGKADYVANESEFGYGTTAVALTALGVVGTVATLGLSSGVRDATFGEAKKAWKKGGSFIGERETRLAAGVLGTVATAGIAPLLPGFNDETFKPGLYGKVEKTLYFPTPKEKWNEEIGAERVNKYGYDWKKPESMSAFLKGLVDSGRGSEIKAMGGDYYWIENRRNVSSAIIIPDGDYSKAYSIEFHDNKTGAPIRNHERQLVEIQKHCASRKFVQEQIEKDSLESAKKIVAKLHPDVSADPNDPAYKALLKATQNKVRRKMQKIVLSDTHIRIYSGTGDVNLQNSSSRMTGTRHALPADLQKTFRTLMKRDLMEYKAKLEGDSIYDKRPEAPSGRIPFPNMGGRGSANGSDSESEDEKLD